MSKIPNLAQDINLPGADNAKTLDDLKKKFKGLVINLVRQFYELRLTINRLINGNFGLLQLEVRTSAPLTAETQTGTIAYADGTGWNPGSGEGVYRYGSDGLWHFLG